MGGFNLEKKKNQDKSNVNLSTEEMLSQLKNVPPERLLLAIKGYLADETIDPKKLN